MKNETQAKLTKKKSSKLKDLKNDSTQKLELKKRNEDELEPN